MVISMKKRVYGTLICALTLFAVIALSACANEAEALQARIDTLEAENAELAATLSDVRSNFDSAQASLAITQNELAHYRDIVAQIEMEQQQAEEQGTTGGGGGAAAAGPLAITYAGVPNPDMSWPLADGNLPLGLRVNLDDFDEDAEIVWESMNESIFTVTPSEDGLSASVTPRTTGSARLIVTIGDQSTESWVRITG
ncbi:MAG: hypothetical protein FWC13_07900 [Oscillospiraceae bacterium]|nr:hypothetical protein [Oscillospiraceae bacterium]